MENVDIKMLKKKISKMEHDIETYRQLGMESEAMSVEESLEELKGQLYVIKEKMLGSE